MIQYLKSIRRVTKMSEYEKWPKEWSNIRVAKMSEYEDPGLNCFHGHTKITTICRTTVSKNNVETSREYFQKLKI